MSDRPLACDNGTEASWMLNQDGLNPCQVLQQIMTVCLPRMSMDPAPAFDTCPTAQSPAPPCCCSSVTFALTSACWYCQSLENSPTDFQTFTGQCRIPVVDQGFPREVSIPMANIDIPPWAFLPQRPGRHWDITEAWRNATASNILPTAGPTVSEPRISTTVVSQPTPSTAAARGDDSSSTHPGAIAGAVIGAVAFVTILFFAAFCWRRRRRVGHAKRGTKIDLVAETPGSHPSSRPYLSHRIDGRVSPFLYTPPAGRPPQQTGPISPRSESTASDPNVPQLPPSAQYLQSLSSPPEARWNPPDPDTLIEMHHQRRDAEYARTLHQQAATKRAAIEAWRRTAF